MPKHKTRGKSQHQSTSRREGAKRRGTFATTVEHHSGLTAAETNALELLGRSEHDLQAALHEDRRYLHNPKGAPISIKDILENYCRLRNAIDRTTLGELWPCLVTQRRNGAPFSAPLDISPSVAAALVAEIRSASPSGAPFPFAPAPLVQSAAAKALPEAARAQPYFFGASQNLVGLPKENVEAGFVRGAQLDVDVRMSSPMQPLTGQETAGAQVAVETPKPNITVVYTHGYFLSTLKQLGISTPALGHLAYGLYRFGIEVDGYHLFQESLVSIPDQLRVRLDLEPQG
jgi:hypothetical protein